MPIGEICNREVIIVEPDATVQEAAQPMRQRHVGTLAVVKETSGRHKPVVDAQGALIGSACCHASGISS